MAPNLNPKKSQTLQGNLLGEQVVISFKPWAKHYTFDSALILEIT